MCVRMTNITGDNCLLQLAFLYVSKHSSVMFAGEKYFIAKSCKVVAENFANIKILIDTFQNLLYFIYKYARY